MSTIPDDVTATGRRTAVAVGRAGVRVARSPVWGEVASPVTRAVGFYTQSWRRQRLPHAPSDIPALRPSHGLAAQAGIDEAILTLARIGRRPKPPEVMAKCLPA